jgi:tripartite-type tricarboxylate transporter receptor subunit TctC
MTGCDLTRRAVLAGLAAAPFGGYASAQTTWPSRPVRVIVPYPPGGGADTTARIIYAKLSEDLGQAFAIENRGGAGGTIAEAVVAKADPDGYTILHDATAFSVNGSLYPDLSFDYRKDFDPVFLVGLVANILVCTPSVPVTTVADVIAFAKASPGGIDMASSGNGTLQHLLLELFARSAGIKINHIPYRGGGLAITDVMAGQVNFVFSNGSAVVGLVKSGKVKAIAETGKTRLASLPDIPPMSDTLPGFEGYDWNGVFVPHGTPAAIVGKLNAGLNAALAAPQVSARFAELNIESRQNTPAEFGAYIEGQMQLWNRVVKEANIKLG